MKVGIVGSLGVVGGACKFGLEKLGHDIVEHDILIESKIQDIINTDICFLCVPTPSKEDDSCDTSIVHDCLKSLSHLNYEGIVAIKSTVTPGSTREFSTEFDNLRLCFVPEFLRERCAITDFVEMHDLLAIGTEDPDVFDVVKSVHGNYPKKVVQLSVTEAELLKYYSNCFNAMKIIFANEFFAVCEKLGARYKNIKDAYILRGMMKDLYLDVNEKWGGYAGMCLPKDVKAMKSLVSKLDLDMDIFRFLDDENRKFNSTVPEGMRK